MKVKHKNGQLPIICWRITSFCDRKCPFCFRPKSDDLGTFSIFRIVNALVESGVKGLGVTGGEPLLKKDIAKILEYAKNKGLKICLATNADLYVKYSKLINRCVDVVGLPIEGSTAKLHNKIRGNGNFQNVMNAIKKLSDAGKKIYISTVLTHSNVSDIKNIEKLLTPFKDTIIYWKIYEIINYKNRPFQTVKNGVITQRAKRAIKNLGKRLGRNKIFYSTSQDRSGASLLINPNGDAIIPVKRKGKTEDLILGNYLIDSYEKIFRRWNELVNFKTYQCHLCALKNVACTKK